MRVLQMDDKKGLDWKIFYFFEYFYFMFLLKFEKSFFVAKRILFCKES